MQLIQARNPSKIATAFFNEATGLPDPLITIWEPKAYPEVLHFLSLGYSCPRKVLINSNTEVIQPVDPQTLINANSPEEYEQVMKILTSQKE
jgi:molybdopterin-guanine dinucleotide biosynthesis protein A